ncbi:MAG: carotenoid 1,2-hydratase [Myxococcota bacterium]
MNAFELPTRSGAYRWYYVDVAAGDFTAVFIFMVGSVFSARYSAALKKGGSPREHAAVNFALYEKGARYLWVLSEYQQVSLSDDARTLRIGDSWLSYDDGRLLGEVKDRTAPFLLTQWGEPTHAALELIPEGPTHEAIRLVDGLSHHWRPIAARATARVQVHSHGLDLRGAAYHDGNHGDVPLGSDLRGWEWARVHGKDFTDITYRPWADGPAARVRVSAAEASCRRETIASSPSTRTSWGLRVPTSLGAGEAPRLLETSPFYARLESSDARAHALGEVADFRRFHSPTVRWMANFRTRLGGAA